MRLKHFRITEVALIGKNPEDRVVIWKRPEPHTQVKQLRMYIDSMLERYYAMCQHQGMQNASSLEPEDTPYLELSKSRQPRGPQSHYTAWTDAQARRILKDGANKVRRAGLPLNKTTLGKYLRHEKHRNTVRKILDWHGLTLDDL